MTDKTQPTELRTEIEKLMPCIACDGSGAYQSSEDEVEQCQYCYEYRFPGIDKLLALFSKTIATKTREAEDLAERDVARGYLRRKKKHGQKHADLYLWSMSKPPTVEK